MPAAPSQRQRDKRGCGLFPPNGTGVCGGSWCLSCARSPTHGCRQWWAKARLTGASLLAPGCQKELWGCWPTAWHHRRHTSCPFRARSWWWGSFSCFVSLISSFFFFVFFVLPSSTTSLTRGEPTPVYIIPIANAGCNILIP